MPEELTDLAKSMIENCDFSEEDKELIKAYPNAINSFAAYLKRTVDDCKRSDRSYKEDNEPIDYMIQHVGYTSEQLGYDK